MNSDNRGRLIPLLDQISYTLASENLTGIDASEGLRRVFSAAQDFLDTQMPNGHRLAHL